MRPRRALVYALLAAAALTGCARGDTDRETTPTPANPSPAASPTVSADPASTGAALTGPLRQALAEAGSYRATVAGPGGGAPARGEAVIEGDRLALHVEYDPRTQITRIDGGGAWYTDEAGTWIDGSGSPDLHDALFPYDQRSQIAGLAAIPTMNNLGTEQVDGVTATHYQGGTTAEEFGRALNPPSDILPVTGGDVAVDVWVDEQNRIVRFDYLLIPGADFAEEITPQTQRTDYSGFGEPVTVETPALG